MMRSGRGGMDGAILPLSLEQRRGKMKNWIQPLKRMNACGDALVWCEGHESLHSAWAECKRGDWMLWLLGKLSGKPELLERKKLVLTACQCARLALPYVKVGEGRPLKAIETTEAWAKGEGSITLEDVRKAANAVGAAYFADAAYAAAYEAACANAANAAYAAAYAADAARSSTLEKCADIVRGYYPVAPKLKWK